MGRFSISGFNLTGKVASNIELVAFENSFALHARELGPMYGM